MDREEFIENLIGYKVVRTKSKQERYSLEENSPVWIDTDFIPENLIFNNKGSVHLKTNKISKGVFFLNRGDVTIHDLKELSGLEFHNSGNIFLRSVEEISSDVVFRNTGGIIFDRPVRIPEGFSFNNDGFVSFKEFNLNLIGKGTKFENPGGLRIQTKTANNLEIKGISNHRVVNTMVEQIIG